MKAHTVPSSGRDLARFIRFGLVGLSGVLVDSAMLYLLHDPANWGWNLMLSKAVAAEVAMISNFVWNDLWTFRDISRQQKGLGKWLGRLLTFNLVGVIGLVLNVLLVTVLVKSLHLHYLIANLVAIATVTLWNFGMNRAFNWRTVKPTKDA